jgi:hypothetical protein
VRFAQSTEQRSIDLPAVDSSSVADPYLLSPLPAPDPFLTGFDELPPLPDDDVPLLQEFPPMPGDVPALRPGHPPTITDEEKAQGFDEIEDITDHRKSGRRREYKVAWKGYPSDQATWEPTKNISSEAKAEYHARRSALDKAALLSTSSTGKLGIHIPRTVTEARSSPEAAFWEAAMVKELDGLARLGTFEELDHEPADTNGTILPGVWTFKVKYNADGTIDRYKARFCAGGHLRKLGIDHTASEVYADVLRLKTLRVCLSAAVQRSDVKIDHWDVPAAFPNTALTKIVYMRPPPGFKKHGVKLLRLRKAIYGLPEAMRLFCDLLRDVLVSVGMTQSKADPALYVLREGDEFIWIPTVVDDLFPIYNSQRLRDKVFKKVFDRFSIEDRGQLTSALGIRFKIDIQRGVIEMDQQEYKREVLEMANLLYCRTAVTPLEVKVPLASATAPPTADDLLARGNWAYSAHQGRMNYLVTATCPQYALGVAHTARHQSNWRISHKKAQQRLLRHIASDLDSKLVYRRQFAEKPFSNVVTFTDASFASYPPNKRDQCRSHSAVLVFVFGNLVWWYSKRQPKVATSPQHAETLASDVGIRETVWQRLLMIDLGTPETGPSRVFIDNKGVVSSTYVTPRHDTNKHISVKFFYKNELTERNIIMVHYLETKRMVADVLTKQLSGPAHRMFVSVMLGYVYVPERDGILLADSGGLKRTFDKQAS